MRLFRATHKTLIAEGVEFSNGQVVAVVAQSSTLESGVFAVYPDLTTFCAVNPNLTVEWLSLYRHTLDEENPYETPHPLFLHSPQEVKTEVVAEAARFSNGAVFRRLALPSIELLPDIKFASITSGKSDKAWNYCPLVSDRPTSLLVDLLDCVFSDYRVYRQLWGGAWHEINMESLGFESKWMRIDLQLNPDDLSSEVLAIEVYRKLA